MQQFLLAQPGQHRFVIGREQHALQVGVDASLLVFAAFGDSQQRQVVVAEHDRAMDAQRVDQAQRFQ